MENKDKDGNVIATATVEVDAIAEKDAKIRKLEGDLSNYKNVALKRLGKLPGDADFVKGADENTGLTVEETVRKMLLEGEYAKLTSDKDEYARQLQRQVSELTLALKNRPETSIGGDNNTNVETKTDSVFTDAQVAELRARAARIKADPEKFIENAKKLLKSR